eukprot:3336415-Rhodomonas_salina.1
MKSERKRTAPECFSPCDEEPASKKPKASPGSGKKSKGKESPAASQSSRGSVSAASSQQNKTPAKSPQASDGKKKKAETASPDKPIR